MIKKKITEKAVTRRTMLKTMGGLAVGATAASLGFPGILKASDTVTIGCPLPLTGVDGIIGMIRKPGIELAVKEINAAGGAGGRKVKLIIEDTASKSKTTIEKARKLVYEDKVDVVIGCDGSHERQAVMSVTKRAKKLFMFPNTHEGKVCEPYFVCIGLIPNQQVVPFSPWIVKNVGKKVYFVGSDYIWPREMAKSLEHHLKAAGGEVVGKEFFPFDTKDFGPCIKRIKDAKPDAIWNNFGGGDAITFQTQASEFGIKLPGLAPHFNELWTSILGPEALEGFYTAGNYFMGLDTPENKHYIKALREQIGDPKAITEYWSELTYSAAWIWAKSVAKADTTDDLKVMKAMTSLEYMAPEGPMMVMPTNHTTRTTIRVAQAQKDGSFKLIEDFGMIDPVEPGCNLAG